MTIKSLFKMIYLIYKNKNIYIKRSEKTNPFQGKKVIFVQDGNDEENADGMRGHLEAIGNSIYKPNFYDKYMKRGLDIILSLGGLILLSPVYLVISLAIKIDDPGPVLFTQKRIGKNKKFFMIHKFRTMKMSTPHDVPTHMLDNPEQYITKVGKFLRVHSLDELPQIWDIFVGNMSIIGPRPGLWNQDLLIAERDKYGANDVKPGLTGLAQISGRDELEISEKAKFDGEYVQKIGLYMDIKCFVGSLHVFSKDKSVVEGGTGRIRKTGRCYTDGKYDEELIGHIGFGESVEVDKTSYKKVLIVGEDSYIGESFKSYILEHYSSNFLVDTVDTLNGSWREKEFSCYNIVYHVAGIAHTDIGNADDMIKEKYYAINTDLAIEVAKKAKSEGVERFIFMSSMIVYGESVSYKKKKVVDKYTVPKPANFYGDSKLQADVVLRGLADRNFTVIILRPPLIYGEGSKGNYPVLAKLAKRLPVFPDVSNERSMLYIDNFCEFLCQVMLVKKIRENAVVLIPQNTEWVKTSEMVKEIAKANGKNIKITELINIFIFLGGKIPGKVGRLINKAFGNNCYTHEISEYKGINYQKVSFEESIKKTEKGVKKTIKKEKNKLEDLYGKKILLIALSGYSIGIIKEMRRLGASVDCINDKPNEGFICKVLGRLQFKLYQKVINKYYFKKIEDLKNKDYNYILVIRGEYTPVNTLKKLKVTYPKAKLILYMWDGLNKTNTKGIEKKWIYYDQVYTFDRIDYENNKEKIDFLPLFYYEEYLPTQIRDPNSNNFKYDISFVGTGHDDRVQIVKKVIADCGKQKKRCFSYFFLPHRFVYIKNKLFNRNFRNVHLSDIKFKMLPFKELYKIYENSFCVVDVENSGQHGLTMRSIEIMGLRRKFITTNKDIVNYDFYNENNILVLDRQRPIVEMSFFDKPYEMLPEELYDKYSLHNWILEVLK